MKIKEACIVTLFCFGCEGQEAKPTPQPSGAPSAPASPPKTPPILPMKPPAAPAPVVSPAPTSVAMEPPKPSMEGLPNKELCARVVQKIIDCQSDNSFIDSLFQEYSKEASYNGWPKPKSAMKSLQKNYLSEGAAGVCKEWMSDAEYFPSFSKKERLRSMAESSVESCVVFGGTLGKPRPEGPWFIFKFITDNE